MNTAADGENKQLTDAKNVSIDAIVSIFPDHGFYKSDQLCFAAVDGGVIFVFGHEPNLTVFAAQALDGGFVTDAGDHDLTVVSMLLGTHHHKVAA